VHAGSKPARLYTWRVETAVIVEGARTPIGRFLGAYGDISVVELGALAAREAMSRSSVEPDDVDQTIFGHARQAGNGPNTGRQVSVRAGVSTHVSAYNVNMACGSGMKAIQLAAQQVVLGESEVVLAGGMENMSRVPFILDRMRTGYRLGDAKVYDAMYRDGLLDPLSGLVMGETAENLVDMYGISREEQDEFALESQQKAEAGRGTRAEEMFDVEVADPKGGTLVVSADEHPRPRTTLDALAKLPPVFRDPGTVTAGNSAGITDGAAATVVMSGSRALGEGREPLATIVASSWAGVPPEIMGIGPVPATKKVLDKAGLSLADIDLIEINEAFAAQIIACERELKFDRDRLNLLGGGISLGHPIGMSGARIVLTLAYQMRERGAALGLATLCISGGQGLAVILERS
jgi:acetyl-CoA C-acetyltransferase